MSKKPPQESIDQARVLLSTLFPKCFTPKGGKKTPLKIGIYVDLLKEFPEMSKRLLRAVLIDYTTGFKYHSCALEGVTRFDLNGNPCGAVSAEAAKFHRSQVIFLTKMRKRRKKKAVQS